MADGIDTRSVKALVKWMKEQKVEEFKVGELEVKFSALAFVPEDLAPHPSIQKDRATAIEEDEMLYAST